MSLELPLTASHRRRLRLMRRSAGWPFQDLIEAELLAAGLLERFRDGDGREILRVSDAGIRVIAATTLKNRMARSAHENLVSRVALEMHRAGRIVWRGLSLRAPPTAAAKTWSTGWHAGERKTTCSCWAPETEVEVMSDGAKGMRSLVEAVAPTLAKSTSTGSTFR